MSLLSFTPTNLPSTRFRQDEAARQEWRHTGSRRRSLFGQDLLVRSVQNGGRFVDEAVLEAVYRHRGDAPLDALLELLEEEEDEERPAERRRPVGDAEDVIALAAAAAAAAAAAPTTTTTATSFSKVDQALAAFYRDCSTLPPWVDPAALARGQDAFLAYAPAIGASLYYRSLVPGFSLPKIAAVLLSTGYLAPPASADQVQRRLLDTGAFVAAVVVAASTAAPTTTTTSSNANGTAVVAGNILPGSTGWTMALQVRVLHAKVRRRLLLRRRRGRQWKVDEYGIPINQEDLAATLLAFSYNSMLGCEMILGRPWDVQERLDFLAFWRYIGWLLGIECGDDAAAAAQAGTTTTTTTTTNNDADAVPEPLCWPPLDPCGPGWRPDDPDPLAHSHALFGSILLHLSKPDATSVQIAHHLLRMGSSSAAPPPPPPSKTPSPPNSNTDKKTSSSSSNNNNKEAWFYFRAYQCRRFVGDEMANALLLPYHPVWYKRLQLRVLSNCYLWILRLYSWAALPGSPFRALIVNFHRRNFGKFLSMWQQQNDGGGASCPFAMVAPPKY